MPNFVTLRGCEASAEVRPLLQQHGIAVGEDLHTVDGLLDVLKAASGSFPAASLRVVYRDSSEWLRYGVIVAHGLEVEQHQVTWSLKEDAPAESKAEPAGETRLQLTVPADSVLDLLADAAHEKFEPSAEGRMLGLPEHFSGLPKARLALAQVAAVLKLEQVQLLLEIDGAHYEATLERKKGVTLAPLYPWLDDDEDRRFVRSALGTPAPGGFEPCPKQMPRGGSKRDLARPFTTGSLKARIDSALEADAPRATEDGFKSFMDTPGAFEELAAALRGPENAGAGFASVRSKLYEVLHKCSPAKALPMLLAGLEGEEDEGVRGQIYACLSTVEDPAAHHALARGLKVEPPGVLERLAQVIWRQKAVVELLVREYLVPAWSSDRALADRIVKVLSDEHVEVRPEWASGAPEDLLKALGPVLAKA